MTAIILLFFIKFSLTYDRIKAIIYARTYCLNYNSAYYNYYKDIHSDDANFVSQCMIEGGMNFTDCFVPWIDNFGCIPKASYLRTCLIQKG